MQNNNWQRAKFWVTNYDQISSWFDKRTGPSFLACCVSPGVTRPVQADTHQTVFNQAARLDFLMQSCHVTNIIQACHWPDMYEMYRSSSSILLLIKFIIELNITPDSVLYRRSVSPWLLPPLECLCLPPPPPGPGPGPPPCLHMSHSHPFLTPCTSRKLCHYK